MIKITSLASLLPPYSSAKEIPFYLETEICWVATFLTFVNHNLNKKEGKAGNTEQDLVGSLSHKRPSENSYECMNAPTGDFFKLSNNCWTLSYLFVVTG